MEVTQGQALDHVAQRQALDRYWEHLPSFERIATARPPLSEPDVWPFSAPAAAGRLTTRESELLQLLADGLTNKEIARRLSLPVETTNTRVRRLLAKLQARSRAHAVALGFRRHLLSRPTAVST